jgi:creatinine amidohydrolase
MTRKHALKDMTWVEFGERLKDPVKPVILLPLGSQEEQGPHCPMGDYMLAEILAIRAAAQADAIAAPVLPFGNADYFKPVPGGIQLRAETFALVMEDMITAFLDHGIEHVVIFNGHTSNISLIEQVTRKLKKERGLIIPTIQVWQVMPPAVWAEIHGPDHSKAKGHGADPMTSVYLHLAPEIMRMDLAAPRQARDALGLKTVGVRAVQFEDSTIELPLDVTDVTANGVMGGDSGMASAEKGAKIADWITGYTARFIAHFRAQDPRRLA